MTTITKCPAWCLEHIDGEHVGAVVTTIRASVPIDSWDAMDDQWRDLYSSGANLAWLRSTNTGDALPRFC